MMLKKFRCLVLAMVLILVFVSCTTFAAVKQVKLVYGTVWPIGSFIIESEQYFKKLVENNSKGQILIDYFPASQLGGGPEMLQAVRTNAQQMTSGGPGAIVTYWSKLGTFDLPYIYRDSRHIEKVASRFTSLIDQDEMAAKTGMRVLAVMVRSPRQLTTKVPVNKLEDIKGLKIRVPEVPVMTSFWRALGTTPTVIPASDLYTALATGTVDAQENPFADIYARKLYEQTKYCALTAHMRELSLMLISNKCWKSLTAAQRKILTNAASKSAKMEFKACLDGEEKDYQLLVKGGMKFTKPDVAPFREKAKTIWGQFGDLKLAKKIEAIK
jgi:tripartite ATP-independent transporter DctP family solute receptor